MQTTVLVGDGDITLNPPWNIGRMYAPPKLSDRSDGRDRLHTRPNVNLARSVSPINVEEQVGQSWKPTWCSKLII